ncbi:MAG: hypothetical protein KIB00_16855 [Paeniclostridium sordellii]|nr:hypothetical protein [Paeniclostridium sordellii]
MQHMIRIIFNDGRTQDVSLLANVSKSEFGMLLNQQLVQNPDGRIELDNDGNAITYNIADISHINVL